MALIHENSMDWAFLPSHLLDSILANLVDLSDFLRFAAVCQPWFSVAIQNKKTISSSSHKQIPMLMVPSGDKNRQKRSLYNISKNRLYNFQLDLSYVKRCCGSSHGWLATLEENYAITLINPFINGGSSIRLPPIIEKTENHDYDDNEYDVHKVILSANPLESDDYVVAAIPTNYCNLAFIKSGDNDWTYVDDIRGLTDVIYSRGKFYAVNQLGNVIVSLAADDGSVFKPQVTSVEPMRKRKGMVKSYLVESSTGDLLYVQRCMVEKEGPSQFVTGDFRVAKLKYNSNCSRPVWIEIDNIGDQALFLGDNHSFSVVASEFPGLQPNSIYYTDDFYFITLYEPFGPRDMGVFNLENKSFKLHYTPDPSNKKLPPPIWIMPTLQGKLGSITGEEHENFPQESYIDS